MHAAVHIHRHVRAVRKDKRHAVFFVLTNEIVGCADRLVVAGYLVGHHVVASGEGLATHGVVYVVAVRPTDVFAVVVGFVGVEVVADVLAFKVKGKPGFLPREVAVVVHVEFAQEFLGGWLVVVVVVAVIVMVAMVAIVVVVVVVVVVVAIVVIVVVVVVVAFHPHVASGLTVFLGRVLIVVLVRRHVVTHIATVAVGVFFRPQVSSSFALFLRRVLVVVLVGSGIVANRTFPAMVVVVMVVRTAHGRKGHLESFNIFRFKLQQVHALFEMVN